MLRTKTLIVDAGALGESALTAGAIAAATDLVVVAQLNVDTVAQSWQSVPRPRHARFR